MCPFHVNANPSSGSMLHQIKSLFFCKLGPDRFSMGGAVASSGEAVQLLRQAMWCCSQTSKTSRMRNSFCLLGRSLGTFN